MAKVKGSGATLIEKLNQPVSWKTFMDVMTHEISLNNRGKESPRDFADLDVEVERMLEQAELSAQRRGVSVEQVLSEMGLMDQSSLDENGELNRDQLMTSLGWSEQRETQSMQKKEGGTKSASRRTRSVVKDEASVLREVQSMLPQLSMDDVSIFLNRLSLDPKISDKLVTCKVLEEANLEELRELNDNNREVPFWQLVVQAGGDLGFLVLVMETETWFPLIDPDDGDFVEHLLENNLMTYRQFKEYKQQQLDSKVPATTLLQEVLGADVELPFLLSEFYKIPVMGLLEFPAFSGSLPHGLVPYFRVFDVIPLELEPEQYIFGVTRPPASLMKEMAASFSAPVSFRLVPQDEFDTRRQRIQQQLSASRNLAAKRMQAREFLELRDRLANTSAVRLVEELFAKALDMGATDIHMEHQEKGFRVRFRVDSILQDAMYIHPELADEVTSRIKILADMDITERRHSQDGHIKASIGNNDVNMRVATVPTYHGERIGIRLVNSGKINLTLEDLGLDGRDMAILERLASRPYGMILTTGPVGSGKTTTLYSNLARLNASELNIITIEDPVEYELDNINQIEVNHKIGFGFAEGLRAVLRQDPNVILLGEIRDHETAAIAIRASMTGLLVFSSLHTNDAVGAVTTFHNFQVPPLLIANSLLGVIAQRLVRRLCHECKELYEPNADERAMFEREGVALDDGAMLARANGCEACYFSGYKGRVGIFEVVEVTTEMRELILNKASEQAMRELAIQNGMRSLSNDALRKVKNHSTSIEEAQRVVFL